MIRKVVDALDRASFALSWIACVLVVLLVLLEILARAVGFAVYFTSEYSAFLMAWLCFFALATVTRERSHIAVDFLVVHMSSTTRAHLAFAAAVLMLLYVVVLLCIVGQLTWTSYDDGLRSQALTRTPLAIPQAGAVIGLTVLLLRACVVAIDAWLEPRPLTSER